MANETAIDAARRRVQEAEAKVDVQQRRYAKLALEGDAATAAARATLAELETALEEAREALQKRVPVQGNVDPMALLAGGVALDREVDDVMKELGDGPLIFNLGHGILPETPIANVERMLKRVRG